MLDPDDLDDLDALLAEVARSGRLFGPIVCMASSAARMRRLRARAAGGLAVLPVETNAEALVDFLIASGRLGEWDSDNRAAILDATGRLLDEIVAAGVQAVEI